VLLPRYHRQDRAGSASQENHTSEQHRNKFDTIKKGAYLALLRQGHTRGLAASLVGIHESGKADQDPEVLVEELGQKPGRSKGVIELGEDLAL
jgi:hypothetical protein